MTSRVVSQLVNGFVAVMLLSACAGAGQDQAQPAIVAANPVVKAIPPEEPVIPRLKPKTPIKAPASPRLSEPDTAEAGSDSNGAESPGAAAHQQLMTQQAPGGGVPGGSVSGEDDTAGGVRGPLGAPIGGGAATDSVAAVPAVPEVIQAEPEPVTAPASPDELKSKAETEVIALLGRPVTTRSEGTGTVWTYRAGTCSLDVYFFLDVADNQRRALSYEMLPPWAEDDATQSCYKALKEAHHVQ